MEEGERTHARDERAVISVSGNEFLCQNSDATARPTEKSEAESAVGPLFDFA